MIDLFGRFAKMLVEAYVGAVLGLLTFACVFGSLLLLVLGYHVLTGLICRRWQARANARSNND